MIVGWSDIQAFAKGEAQMGAWPDAAAIRPGQRVVLLLEDFATNAADRPVIEVKINGREVTFERKKPLFAAGLAVLNHPYWIGVFEGPCLFDGAKDS